MRPLLCDFLLDEDCSEIYLILHPVIIEHSVEEPRIVHELVHERLSVNLVVVIGVEVGSFVVISFCLEMLHDTEQTVWHEQAARQNDVLCFLGLHHF